MKGMSDVCQSLARRNLDRLPESFLYHPGEPGRDGLQEIFWACTLELTDELLGGPPPPVEVCVGREQLLLKLDAADWTALAREMGLHEAAARCRAAQILAAQLLPPADDAALAALSVSPLLKHASARLLGLVLFTCHLDWMGRDRPPRFYPFDYLALGESARRHPCPAAIGAVDGVQVAREFMDYAAIRLRHEWTLKTAFHAFLLPLRLRLAEPQRRAWKPPALPAEPALSSDFLLRSLGSSAAAPAAANPAAAPATPAWASVGADVLEELNRLRAENDRLRGLSLAHGLTALLEPLLKLPADPLVSLGGKDAELTRLLLHALAGFLHRPEVELFGAPGEDLRLKQLEPDYQLDPAVPPARRQPLTGWFRVTRRGLRLNGSLVAPALVVPCPARQS